MQQIQLFIGGSWRDAGTGEFISVINPVNEQVIGQIGKASDADIEDAVQASA